MSASGFQAESTYISFQILLPEQGGWVFEDVAEGRQGQEARHEHSEFNKRKCVTHVSHGCLDPSFRPDDELVKYAQHFCFPFDYQFLKKTKVGDGKYSAFLIVSVG